ncbi:MAG: hypothetical protein ACOYIB_07845 [Desulfosporosinus sp.]|jgi:hypothetical protein
MSKKKLLILAFACAISVLIIQSPIIKEPKSISGYLPIQNNITLASNYQSLEYIINDYSVKFEVPDATEVYVSPDKGEQLRFSIYLVNSKLAYRGYIQAWNIENLEGFLSDSKALSPLNYRTYKINNVKHNDYRGFQIEWITELGQKLTSGNEYWVIVNDNEEVIRILYITDTATFPSEMQNIIELTLNSLRIETSTSKIPNS